MILLQRLQVHALKHLRALDLWFPRHGSVLVEGPNEAGKSTLFEAVYFALYGAPLVAEDGLPPQQALLPHDGGSAAVHLTFLVGDLRLEVRRTLVAGKRQRHEATLTLHRPSSAPETLSTVSSVNARILHELRGLDGGVLRNSCLMEQQALDRLEMLSREAREAAIARLLGLDRLVAVERSLRTDASSEATLARLRGRLAVARQRTAARVAEQAAETQRQRLAAGRAHALVVEREALAEEERQATTEAAAVEQRIAALEGAVATGRQTRAHAATLDALRVELATASVVARQVEERAARLEHLAHLRTTELPAAEARLATLRDLEASLQQHEAACTQASQALQQAEAIAAAEAQLATTRAAEAQARSAVEAAAAAERRATARDALHHWLHLRGLEALTRDDDARADLAAERETLEAVEAVAHRAHRRALVPAALALAATLALALAATATHALWALAVVAGIAASVLLWRWQRAGHAATKARAALTTVERQLTRLRAEQSAAQRLSAAPGELATIEAELRAAALPMPDAPEQAQAHLAALGTLPETSTLRDATRAAEQRHAQARAERAQAEAQRATLPTTTDRSASAWAERLAEAEAARATDWARVAALGVGTTAADLASARGAAEAALDHLRTETQPADALARAQAADVEAWQRTARDLAARLAALSTALVPDGPPPPGAAEAPHTLPALEATVADLAALLGPAQATLAPDAAEHDLGAQRERRQTLTQAAAARAARQAAIHADLRAQLAAEQISSVGDEAAHILADRWPLLRAVADEPLTTLEQAASAAQQAAALARHEAERLAREEQVEDVALDEAECLREYTEAERAFQVRARAAGLAAEARARIVRRVLPETQRHMQALLPDLTAGRYRDVELLPGDGAANAADLRLRMWDQMAGRYVAKSLFSGGTRDQCSLALRLAFALATLPRELGAIPGFIFLDEPLSTFDAERSQALVRVLTEGVIGQHFAQVFVISHSQSFDPSSFRYLLRMSEGRIVETTLPSAREARALWEQPVASHAV